MSLDAELVILGKVALAALLGGIVGFEREATGKPAGLRTTMLVCVSTCLLMGLADVIVGHFSAMDSDSVSLDPMKLMEAIVVGIAFIGGGTIIQKEGKDVVKNLTTAATLLVVGGVGVAVALEQFWIAAGVTLLVLVVNYVLLRLEERMDFSPRRKPSR